MIYNIYILLVMAPLLMSATWSGGRGESKVTGSINLVFTLQPSVIASISDPIEDDEGREVLVYSISGPGFYKKGIVYTERPADIEDGPVRIAIRPRKAPPAFMVASK